MSPYNFGSVMNDKSLVVSKEGSHSYSCSKTTSVQAAGPVEFMTSNVVGSN